LKYHPACLVALYNRERAHLFAQECAASSEKQAERQSQAIAFSELVTFIMESCNSTADPQTFRLADLVALYKSRVE
jgi:hypothetical protein